MCSICSKVREFYQNMVGQLLCLLERLLGCFLVAVLTSGYVKNNEGNFSIKANLNVVPSKIRLNYDHRAITENNLPITVAERTRKNDVDTSPFKIEETYGTSNTFCKSQRKSVTNNQNSSCFHILDSISICPDGFNLLEHNHKKLCFIVIEDQQHPPRCPYPNFLPYYLIKPYIPHHFYNETVWVHVARNTISGFPDFEWTENGYYYGKALVTEEMSNPNCIYDKNCVVSKNGGLLERVSCSDKHKSLCIYSMDELQHLYSHLCNQPEYYKCILADYDLTKPRCFCKKFDRTQPPRKEFCTKPAEPVLPFQTELMTKYFDYTTDSSMCWIGLHKEEVGCGVNYKWSSTNSNVTYTRWARPEDCRYSEGAFKFNTPPFGGWALTRDRTLKCAICEFVALPETCTLQLHYVPATNEIELVIHNYISVRTGDDFNIYCFTDSNDDGFKKTIPVGNVIVERNKSRAISKIADIADHPAYYWCEAFQHFSQNSIRSNAILAYNTFNGYGHEFALHVGVTVNPGIDPFLEKVHVQVVQSILGAIKQQYSAIQNIRPMRAAFNENKLHINLIVHLTTKKSSQSATFQHKVLSNIFSRAFGNDSIINITQLLGSEVCFSSKTVMPDDQELEWPETRIGATVIPTNVLCLDTTQGMIPVTRKCEGDFLQGAKWADPVGTCFSNTTYSETTKELFDLVYGNVSAETMTTDLTRISQQKSENYPIDVHLISSILGRLVVEFKGEVNSTNFSTIISNIMNFDRKTIKEAQFLLNSTDRILSFLDDFLNGEHPISIITSNLIVQITDLNSTNITGMALYTDAVETFDFKSYTVVQLFDNTSFENLLKSQYLETAVLLPSDILGAIKAQLPLNQPRKLVIAIFFNDILFNEKENFKSAYKSKSKSKIISASIPGFTGSFASYIRMAFKLPKNYLNTKNCSHWIYGLDATMVSTYGKWETDKLSQASTDLLEICNFSHMTHFGLLLQGGPLEEQEKRALEILIAVGSAMSLIGVIPIFLTACLFRSWRHRSGNIILLNCCISIAAEIILSFSLYAVEEDGASCVIIGSLLHYIDLSEFCWMLIIAFLQYRRFVIVFRPQQECLVGKCLLFGWLTPLFPVIITISVSYNNYRRNPGGYCYVVGDYFTYGCIMPIVIILTVNLIIFVAIIYSISNQNVASHLQRSHNYKLEILLALFLFFTLGLTWFFGIVGMLGGGIWFIYIFCATATLRGLVLFLFCILGNKEIRQLWRKRFSYYVSKEKLESRGPRISNTGTLSSE